MGLCNGNVLYFILNCWKLMSYCSMMGRYLLAIHRPLQPSILWTAGPLFIYALIALNHLCHPTSTVFLVTLLISRKSYPLWRPWLVPLQKHLSLQLKMAHCPLLVHPLGIHRQSYHGFLSTPKQHSALRTHTYMKKAFECWDLVLISFTLLTMVC